MKARGDASVWLALDVGGANLKAAHQAGRVVARPFEVWKEPGKLPDALRALGKELPPFDQIALTMTAEICDCFPSKAVGVSSVLGSVASAFPDRPILVWGTDGRFHSFEDIKDRPVLAAAANWLALASAAAKLAPARRGVLIDIGTTTTDLIPLDRGEVASRGRTDTERLQTGELVYAGVRRTPLCALATELPFRGTATGLAAELFATTLDVSVILGDIEPDASDLATADGLPATVPNARRRLARMVGADLDEIAPGELAALAEAASESLLSRLARAAARACDETIGAPEFAIVAGSGEFLARRVAGRLLSSRAAHSSEKGAYEAITSLSTAWGPRASIAACAFALLELVGARPIEKGREAGR